MSDEIKKFAQQIKAKYPDYDGVDDYELVERTIRKHPVYASQVPLPKDFRLLKTSSGHDKIDELYEQIGREENVDPNLLLEQGRQETIRFNPRVFYGTLDSPKGARGAGQFMPQTAPLYDLKVGDGVDERTDPVKSIRAQAKYMRKLLDQFNDDERLALAGYNAGEHRQSLKQGKIPRIKETEDYVARITENLNKARSSSARALRDFFNESDSPTTAATREAGQIPAVSPPEVERSAAVVNPQSPQIPTSRNSIESFPLVENIKDDAGRYLQNGRPSLLPSVVGGRVVPLRPKAKANLPRINQPDAPQKYADVSVGEMTPVVEQPTASNETPQNPTVRRADLPNARVIGGTLVDIRGVARPDLEEHLFRESLKKVAPGFGISPAEIETEIRERRAKGESFFGGGIDEALADAQNIKESKIPVSVEGGTIANIFARRKEEEAHRELENQPQAESTSEMLERTGRNAWKSLMSGGAGWEYEKPPDSEKLLQQRIGEAGSAQKLLQDQRDLADIESEDIFPYETRIRNAGIAAVKAPLDAATSLLESSAIVESALSRSLGIPTTDSPIRGVGQYFDEQTRRENPKDAGERWQFAVTKSFKGWLDRTLPQTAQLQQDFLVTQVPDTLGQIAAITFAGAASGGAALPTLIGASQGATELYKDAAKHGAKENARLFSAGIGAVLAVPDALLFTKWFKAASPEVKAGVVKRFADAVRKRLGVEVGEKAAEQIERKTLSGIAKAGVKDAAFEGAQEESERIGGDINAKYLAGYDLNRKLKPFDAKTAALGAIGGAAGNIASEGIPSLLEIAGSRGLTETGEAAQQDNPPTPAAAEPTAPLETASKAFAKVLGDDEEARQSARRVVDTAQSYQAGNKYKPAIEGTPDEYDLARHELVKAALNERGLDLTDLRSEGGEYVADVVPLAGSEQTVETPATEKEQSPEEFMLGFLADHVHGKDAFVHIHTAVRNGQHNTLQSLYDKGLIEVRDAPNDDKFQSNDVFRLTPKGRAVLAGETVSSAEVAKPPAPDTFAGTKGAFTLDEAAAKLTEKRETAPQAGVKFLQSEFGLTSAEAKNVLSEIENQSPENATGFKTAKGSTYTVSGQSTQRDKAFRPEHGKDDVGTKEPSEITYYAENADQLSEIVGLQNATGKRIVTRKMPNGDVFAIAVWDNAEGKKGTTKRNLENPVKLTTTPRVGLSPVELWKSEAGSDANTTQYRGVHVGNPITEIFTNETNISPEPTPPPRTRQNADAAPVASETSAAQIPAAAPVEQTPRVVEHPNPEINGKPVVAETADGKIVVANPQNKSGVSIVRASVRTDVLPTLRPKADLLANKETEQTSAVEPETAPETVVQSNKNQTSEAAPKPRRSYRAGMNQGEIVFASELQRDLYDLGANDKYTMSGGQNKTKNRAVRDTSAQKTYLAKQLGVPESEISNIASQVYRDTKEQMRGLKDGETRQVADNVPKPETANLQDAETAPITEPLNQKQIAAPNVQAAEPKQRKKPSNLAANPSKDTLFEFVAKSGGIRPSSGAVDLSPLESGKTKTPKTKSGAPRYDKFGKRIESKPTYLKHRITPVVNKNGMDAQDMMREAIEAGYLAGTDAAVAGAGGDASFTVNDFIEAVAESYRDRKHYSTENDYAAQIEQELPVEDTEFDLVMRQGAFLKNAEVRAIIEEIEQKGDTSDENLANLEQIAKYQYDVPNEVAESLIEQAVQIFAAKSESQTAVQTDSGSEPASFPIGDSQPDSERESLYEPEITALESSDNLDDLPEDADSFDFADEETASTAQIKPQKITSVTDAGDLLHRIGFRDFYYQMEGKGRRQKSVAVSPRLNYDGEFTLPYIGRSTAVFVGNNFDNSKPYFIASFGDTTPYAENVIFTNNEADIEAIAGDRFDYNFAETSVINPQDETANSENRYFNQETLSEPETAEPKPSAAAETFGTDLFGNALEPTEQTDLFGKTEIRDLQQSASEANRQLLTDAYGDRTVRFIESLENHRDRDVARVARDLRDSAKLVAAKGDEARSVVEAAADALDLFVTARNQNGRVDEIINQPRLDAVPVSQEAEQMARQMENGTFAGKFRAALSEAKTEATREPNLTEKQSYETTDNGNVILKSIHQPFDDVNLENLYNARGEIDYERVENVARRIGTGSLEIERLDSQSERGRIRGGQRAIEASVILAASERAIQEKSSASNEGMGSHSVAVRRQERTLENYAKRNDIWFKPGHFPERLYLGRGGEARVYQKDENRVVKLIDYRHIDKSLTPLDFIDNRIALFNHLFPETPYELMGFMRDGDGNLRFVVTQPLVQGNVPRAQADIDALMNEKGFERTGRESYGNALYQVHDLHVGNVLKDDSGNVFVIDAVPKYTPEKSAFRVAEATTESGDNEILKKARTAELTAELKSLRGQETMQLAPMIADIEQTGDRVSLNPAGAEIIRQAVAQFEYRDQAGNKLEDVPVIDGIFLDDYQLPEIIQLLRNTADAAESPDFGYAAEETRNLRDLADALETAGIESGNGTARVGVFDDAMPHEAAHAGSFAGATPDELGRRLVENRHKDLQTFKDWADFGRVKKVLQRIGYRNLSDAKAVEEIFAHILGGDRKKLRISEDSAADFLMRFYASYAETHGIDSLEAFEKRAAEFGAEQQTVLDYLRQTRENYAETQRQTDSTAQTETADDTGSESGGGRDEGISQESGRRSGAARSDAETSAGSGREENVSDKFSPSGKEKLSQTPKSARAADIPLADRVYTSTTNAEQQAFADRQLDKGIENAAEWFESQADDQNLNSGATAVVGINLMNQYGKAGDIENLNRVADRLVPLVTESAQTVQAMTLLSGYSPETAPAYAAKLKKQATGKDLTEKELEKAQTVAREFSESAQAEGAGQALLDEAKRRADELEKERDSAREAALLLENKSERFKLNLDAARRLIRNLKAQVARLQDAKPAKQRKRSPEQLQKEIADARAEILEQLKNFKPAEILKKIGENLSIEERLRGVYPDLKIDISERSDSITLNRVEVPKATRGGGIGSAFMRDLVSYADGAGKTILLTPDTSFGATSVNRLKDFYKRFGFVENKGRKRDFTLSESMYRTPESNEILKKIADNPTAEDVAAMIADYGKKLIEAGESRGVKELSERLKNDFGLTDAGAEKAAKNAYRLRTKEAFEKAKEREFLSKGKSDEQIAREKAHRKALKEAAKEIKDAKFSRAAISLMEEYAENDYSDAALFHSLRRGEMPPADAIKELKAEFPDLSDLEIRNALRESNKLTEAAKKRLNDKAAQAANEFKLTAEDVERLQAEQRINTRAKTKAARDAAAFYDNLTKSKAQVALETAMSYRKANLLTAPKRLFNDILSNAAHLGAEEISRASASAADIAASYFTGERSTQGIAPRAIGNAIKNLAISDDVLKKVNRQTGLAKAIDIIRHGTDEDTLKGLQIQESHAEDKFGTTGKVADAYINTVFRTISAGDALFKAIAYRRALEEIAKVQAINEKKANPDLDLNKRRLEILRNPSEAAQIQAIEYSIEATFQNENRISAAISRVRHSHIGVQTAADIVLPFDRTPTNIVLNVLNYTPAGFIRAGYALKNRVNPKPEMRRAFDQQFRAAVESDTKTDNPVFNSLPKVEQAKQIANALDKLFKRRQQAQFAKMFGKATTGTVAGLTLGYLLASLGLLAGSMSPNPLLGDDDEKDEFFARKKAGIENRSLLIPGVGRFTLPSSPSLIALTTGATIYEQSILHKGKSGADAWQQTANGVSGAAKDVVFELPILRTTADLFGRKQSAGAFAGNVASGFIPAGAIVRDIGEAIDEKARRATESPESRKQGFWATQRSGFGNAVLSKIPFARNYADEQTNTISPTERGTFGRRVVRALDPFNSRSPVTNAEVERGKSKTSGAVDEVRRGQKSIQDLRKELNAKIKAGEITIRQAANTLKQAQMTEAEARISTGKLADDIEAVKKMSFDEKAEVLQRFRQRVFSPNSSATPAQKREVREIVREFEAEKKRR